MAPRLLPRLLVLAVALAAPGAAPAQTGGASAAQMQALEAEVRRLNGRIQELEFQLKQIADDAAFRFNDLDYRLTEQEGGDPTLLGEPVPLGGGGTAAPAAGGGGTPAIAVSERVAMEDAVASLQAGDVEDARRRLLAFLAQYPDGPLTAEAEFWLGTAEFERADYRAAARTFLSNISAYPSGAKTPDSFLMLGRSLEALGQIGQACATWSELQARSPGSSAATEAQSASARLSCG
ncbi:MAG: tol-pal system protein YbgF [Pseudomonadota bacterium]